jgi:neutral amino acid transport system permease protein
VLGPVIGAMILWFILAFTDNFLNQAVAEDLIPSAIMSGTQVGQVRFMLVGLALILLMVYRPQGIFGDRREIALDAH